MWTPAQIVHKQLQTSKTSGHSRWCSLWEMWKTFRHETKFAKAHKIKASRSTYWVKSRRRGGHREHKYWTSWPGGYAIWPFDRRSHDFWTFKWFVANGINAKLFRPSFFDIRLDEYKHMLLLFLLDIASFLKCMPLMLLKISVPLIWIIFIFFAKCAPELATPAKSVPLS